MFGLTELLLDLVGLLLSPFLPLAVGGCCGTVGDGRSFCRLKGALV
jgi:hypothetical protein